MLCCPAVQLQGLCIGVTTNNPDTGPLTQEWDDYDISDQYWHVLIWSGDCEAWHKGQSRLLRWDLDDSAGNTFGFDVSEKGELHLYHNGRDVGMAFEGLPTDQPLWGFVDLSGGWKVEANYIIAKGEAVCGVSLCSSPCTESVGSCLLTWLLQMVH